VIATASRERCVFRRDYGSLTLDVPPSEISRWRAVSRVLRSPLDTVGCALFPASCSLCGSPLPHLSSIPICAACWSEVSPPHEPVCVRCGDALDRPLSSQPVDLCRACRLAPPPFVKAVSVSSYQGRLRDLIHALKYEGLRPAARRLGEMLAGVLMQSAPELPGAMLVVPVPLHRSKNARRGFNQARLLAAETIRSLRKRGCPSRFALAPATLMRLRATESQAGLTPRQRRLNVRGAFGVSDPRMVAGKHVLLIDDILTTGATARAASRALLQAGAASVWVATLARARRFDRAARSFSEPAIITSAGNDVASRSYPEHANMNSQSQPSF
jgi:ComF family protein